MNAIRRTTLKAAGAAFLLASGLLHPLRALAATWNKAAFASKTPADALKGIGASSPLESKDILIEAPQIAENGAVVPIAIQSNIPKTDWIAIVVPKNPNALSAAFDIPAGTDPSISTRVKMGQSSDVLALIRADGKYFVATREIKVEGSTP